jgi:hypothetical protein
MRRFPQLCQLIQSVCHAAPPFPWDVNIFPGKAYPKRLAPAILSKGGARRGAGKDKRQDLCRMDSMAAPFPEVFLSKL